MKVEKSCQRKEALVDMSNSGDHHQQQSSRTASECPSSDAYFGWRVFFRADVAPSLVADHVLPILRHRRADTVLGTGRTPIFGRT